MNADKTRSKSHAGTMLIANDVQEFIPFRVHLGSSVFICVKCFSLESLPRIARVTALDADERR